MTVQAPPPAPSADREPADGAPPTASADDDTVIGPEPRGSSVPLPADGRRRWGAAGQDVRAVRLRYSALRCEQRGRVLTVRVDAPPFNFMTAAMQVDIIRIVAAVERDMSVGAVVLTGGVPGRYITHYDIADLLHSAGSNPPMPRPVASAAVRTIKAVWRLGGRPARRLLGRTPAADLMRLERFQTACAAILRSPAVWIAAIDGPCGGGGIEMSGYFDLRMASDRSELMLPELSIGLSTTFGAHRLATLIGPARALRLMLDASSLTAAQAHDVGWIDVVTTGDVVAEAQQLAELYSRRPRAVVGAQKALLNDTVPLSESLMREVVDQTVGLPSASTRAALTLWLKMQDPAGDSTFLTDPEPWRNGTAMDLNP